MYHFFVEESQIDECTIRIIGSDVNHMKNVLRMKPGETVSISSKEGAGYICTIDTIENEEILLTIDTKVEDTAELPCRITLFQGLPKSDKMELIIQKAVELGAAEIVPVVTRRTIVKLDEKKAKARVARWNTISEGAAKQSGRSAIPVVSDVMSYKEALKKAADMDVVLIPFEHAENMDHTREVLSKIPRGASIGIFIGPEGGFEDAEVEACVQNAHAEEITLGKRILRTETAGLAILSMLVYLLEE